ncbi:MAG: hypothetical protein ACI9JM_003268 [Halioglobus sp.]|jgi:hypothetical protein
MSKREDQFSLDTLPKPPSPAALDDKILAYARQQAPQKQPLWRSGWVSGIATAGVVAIAVLIADPSQQTPSFKDVAQEQELPSYGYTSLSGLREERLSAPSPEESRKRSALVMKPQLKAKPKSVVRKIAAITRQPSMPATAMIAEDMAGDSAESASLAYTEADSVPSEAERVAESTERPVATTRTLTARQQTRQLTVVDTSVLHEEKGTAMPPIKVGDTAFVEQLAACERLLESGKSDEASTLYQQLQKSCADCQLPQSLEEAIAQQQAREEANATSPKKTAPQ